MRAYYNDFDKNTCAWARELINMGMVPKGYVDERSILDIKSEEITGYRQLHFFCGILGWPFALQLAGWPDDEPVWTASLPCQPFSNAGKGLGKADERHLLPHFLELVDACRPPIIFGEQVSAAIRHGWLDDLCDEMERKGYTVRAAVLTAAGVGAPHIRQRLYWVAYQQSSGWNKEQSYVAGGDQRDGEAGCDRGLIDSGSVERMAYSNDTGSQGRTRAGCADQLPAGTNGMVDGRMGFADSTGSQQGSESAASSRLGNTLDSAGWNDLDWIECRDGKKRPVKSGIKPLAYGIPKRVVRGGDSGVEEDANQTLEARVMRLKGYGNAIVPPVAAMWVQAVMNEINN